MGQCHLLLLLLVMLSLPVALVRSFHQHRIPLLPAARFATSRSSSAPGDGSEKKTRRPRATKKAEPKKKDSGVALRVSDVAAIVGRHAYKSADEVFNEMHLKYSPHTFTGVTRAEMMQQALDNAPTAVKNAVYSTIAHRAAHSQDAIAQSQRTEQLVLANPALADADKAAVIELLKSRVYTSHGARAEAGTARKVEVEQSTVLVADSKMYTHELLTLEERRFFLRGKIDRLEMVDGELVLVEIKNRMKRLFMEVREYENIQIQTYMQMIPGNVRRAKLIEQYMDDTHTLVVERDDALWTGEVVPALHDFCARLHVAMGGPGAGAGPGPDDEQR